MNGRADRPSDRWEKGNKMSNLPTATLGRTGLSVTRLGYGAMEVRGSRIWGGRPVTEEESDRILNAVLNSGITFIDTANDYGRSEEFIGKFLSARRSEYVLATKCGCTVVRRDENTDDTPHVWTRENLFRGLHESLERMKTDYVDVMQLHNPSVEQTESGDLRRRAAGDEGAGQGSLPRLFRRPIRIIESVYRVGRLRCLSRFPIRPWNGSTKRAIQSAADSGAGVIVRGGVARGEPGVGLGGQDRWAEFEKAGLDELMEEGESRTSFLLRWTLNQPGMSTNIVGTKNPEHLATNIAAAARGPLSAATYAEAKRRLDALGEGSDA